MSYNDQDYQKLAKAIVDDLVERAIPLEDSVVKLATDQGLNAYETRRLLEATNLNAHLVLFEKMADHKYVDFDVVDPESVCEKLFASPDPRDHEGSDDMFGKTASLNLELPDERWEKLSFHLAEKLAAEAFPAPAVPEPVDPYAGDKLHHAVQLTTKVAEELKMRALGAHMHYTDKVAALAETFSYLSAMPFEEFEKDAHAIADADRVVHILAKMREVNPRLPETAQVKTASARRFVVERKEHALFREVVAAYNEALDLALGYQWYEAQAEPLLR
jgi:hypothetical protein